MKKLLILLIFLPLSLRAQSRFIRVVNSIAELQASNPVQIHTNVFVVGPTNSGVYSYFSGLTNHTLPFYPTLYPGATGIYVHIITPTGAGVTNINSVLSGNYNPGTNVVFTTNSFGAVTINSSGGGGTNAFQVFSGFYGGALPTDVPTTTAALAYDLDPPGALYFWDGLLWY